MQKTLAELLAPDLPDPFFLSKEVEASYADLSAATAKALHHLREAGVPSGVPVVIVGDFCLESIAPLIALIENGNIIVPHTAKSFEKLTVETDLLQPAFEIDATGAEMTVKALSPAPQSPLDGVIPEGAPGLVVFTSGTSGRPKAIVHNILQLVEKFSSRKSRTVRAIPFLLFDHMGGFNTLISILIGRGSIVYSADRGVDAICAGIERFKVDLLPTTPTFLSMLLVSEAYTRYDLSSLRMVTYGTEVMNEALLKRLNTILPDVRFKQTYGLSEVGVLMTSSKGNDNTWVKLLGDDLETKVEDGILWVKTPSVMLGRVFYEDAGARFEAYQEDWFCTGDMVDVDGEYFRFKGRASEIINVAGLKVYPSEVENCLIAVPGVANAVVFSTKNPLVGQFVTAKVELEDATADTKEMRVRILSHCRENLDKFKVPREIQFVEGMEVTDRLKKRRGWDGA